MSKLRTWVAVAICLVVVLGVVSVFSPVQAKRPGGPGGCVCTMEYAPVLCDDGKIYSNQCVANCHHAHGCVPIGPGPIPL